VELDERNVVTTLNAIETVYAGCRFRSRLEARWAVAFDHLGVMWEYEPQGFMVGPQGYQRSYLPDFYLPTMGTWVEVKGDPNGIDLALLADAVHPKTGLGRPDPYWETSVLILGPIPEPGSAYLHWRVSRSSYAPCDQFCACADMQFSQVAFLAAPRLVAEEARDAEGLKPREVASLRSLGAFLHQVGRSALQPFAKDLTKAQPSMLAPFSTGVDEAYRAARSARFEHGESG
jgi:hypothetical protein